MRPEADHRRVSTLLRLAAVIAAVLATSAGAALGLWRAEQSGVRDQARRDARAAAAAIEDRAEATLLAIRGVRAAYDSGPVERAEFVRLARVPLARPEVVSVGWAPRVAADERSTVEVREGIRIGAPADALFTYPILLREPAATGGDRPDLGSDPTLGPVLRDARGRAEARLSPPVRLADGRVGLVAFVPVYATERPPATPGERRDALRGLVVAEVDAELLTLEAVAAVHDARAVRVMQGPSVLFGEPLRPGATAVAAVDGNAWTVAVETPAASPAAPAAAGVAGLVLAALLLVFRRRIESLTTAARKLQSNLSRERTRSQQRLRAVQQRVDETERAVGLIADAEGAVVLDVDADGVVRTCTAGSSGLLGWQPDELVGSTVFELLHPDDLLAPATGRHRYRHRDGSFVMLETSRVLRRDALGFVTDVVTILREPPAESLRRTAAQRIAAAVALEPDPVELYAVVAEEAAAELRAPQAAVVRFDDGFGTVVGVAADAAGAGGPGSTVTLDETTPAGQVRLSGRPVPGAAPLHVGGRLWGALTAEQCDAEALSELAEHAQGAVAYASTAARLAALSTRDPLTNLPDRRAFGEQLRSEVRRAQRHERALAVVLVDLDGLRDLNERLGRLAADRVLAEAARRLGAAVRHGEIVSRLAADRFAWILPETEGLNAWIAAERGRRAVTAEPYGDAGLITASAGICDLEDARSAEELLGRAEAALSASKASGGDATFRFSEELDAHGASAGSGPRTLDRLRELADRLDAAEPGGDGHSLRVARLAEKLALAAGWSAADALRLAQVGLLHDVGKLAVAEDVLQRPGPLAEDAIPSGARLLALAEAWDAMTTARLSGDARPLVDALDECRRERGRQFAPDAVDALERLWALGALGADSPASVFD